MTAVATMVRSSSSTTKGKNALKIRNPHYRRLPNIRKTAPRWSMDTSLALAIKLLEVGIIEASLWMP